MPRIFSIEFFDYVTDKARLTDREGNSIEVRVMKYIVGLFLLHGWSNIAKLYDLTGSGRLVGHCTSQSDFHILVINRALIKVPGPRLPSMYKLSKQEINTDVEELMEKQTTDKEEAGDGRFYNCLEKTLTDEQVDTKTLVCKVTVLEMFWVSLKLEVSCKLFNCLAGAPWRLLFNRPYWEA